MTRLRSVMIARIILVTLMLGGAILITQGDLLDGSNIRSMTLGCIILLTYVLSIVYALWERSKQHLLPLARVQLAMDLGMTFVLVMSTGGLKDSIFSFTLALPIVASALVLGRATAMISAVFVSIMMVALALMSIGTIPNPYVTQLNIQSVGFIKQVFFEVGVQILISFVLAGISGQLSKQLGDVRVELAQQRIDILELRALNINILSSINSGLMTITSDQRIIFFNTAAELITGRRSQDLLGHSVVDEFPGLVHETVSLDLKKSEEKRFEAQFEHVDGHMIDLGFSVSALKNSETEVIGRIIIFQDLTKIKHLERQAAQSEHMAAIGELSASIAHEIRNPLAAISGSVEMMQVMQADELSEDTQTLIGIVITEVERLNMLLTKFLDYSRPNALNIDQLNIHNLINQVIELFKIGQEVPVEIVVKKDDFQDIIVYADHQATQQVLWNLLTNAVQAQAHANSASIHVSLDRDQTHAFISIEDAGQGVPKDLQQKIFEPFFTTKTTGTGLGLAVLYRIIQDHRGTCTYATGPTLGGAMFTISLPLNVTHTSTTIEAL